MPAVFSLTGFPVSSYLCPGKWLMQLAPLLADICLCYHATTQGRLFIWLDNHVELNRIPPLSHKNAWNIHVARNDLPPNAQTCSMRKANVRQYTNDISGVRPGLTDSEKDSRSCSCMCCCAVFWGGGLLRRYINALSCRALQGWKKSYSKPSWTSLQPLETFRGENQCFISGESSCSKSRTMW